MYVNLLFYFGFPTNNIGFVTEASLSEGKEKDRVRGLLAPSEPKGRISLYSILFIIML